MGTEHVNIIFRENGTNVIKRNLDELGMAANRATRSIFLLERALFVIGGAGLLRGLTSQLDLLTNYENRLKLTTISASNLQDVQTQLFEIAKKSRTSFEGVNEIYNRTALSARELGVSQKELLRFTESVSKAAVLSGANAREANAALIQLGQGISSNRLGGDELRSILEQLPLVADIIAKQFGVTRGELRQLGTEGKITADQILAAFRNSAAGIDKDFAKLVPTIGQSLGIVRDSFLALLDAFDDATGFSEKVSMAIISIADNLKGIMVTATAVGVTLAGVFAGKAIHAVMAYVAGLKAAQIKQTEVLQRLIAIRTAVVAKSAAVVTAANIETRTTLAAYASRQAELQQNLALIAQKKLLLQQQVLESQYVIRNGVARNAQTGQFVNLAIAKQNLINLSQKLSIVEGVETAQAARLAAARAAQAAFGAQAAQAARLAAAQATAQATGLAVATTRLAAAQAAALGWFVRLRAVLPGVAVAIGAVRGAFMALFATIMANPIGILLTGLLAVQLYMSLQTDATEELKSVQEQLNDSMAEYASGGGAKALSTAKALSAENRALAASIRDVAQANVESAAANPYTFDPSSGLGSGSTESEIVSLQASATDLAMKAQLALNQEKMIVQELIRQNEQMFRMRELRQFMVGTWGQQLQLMGQTRAESDAEYQKAMEILTPMREKAEILRLSVIYGENSIEVLKQRQRTEMENLLTTIKSLKIAESVSDQMVIQLSRVQALERVIAAAGGATDTLGGKIKMLAAMIQPAIDKARELLAVLSSSFGALRGITTGISNALSRFANSGFVAKAKEGFLALFNKAKDAKDLKDFQDSLLPDGAGGGGGASEDALAKLREQIALETRLLGLSEAQRQVETALSADRDKYSQLEIDNVTKEIEALNAKKEAIAQMQSISDKIKSSMEEAFMSIVEGTQTMGEAFKKMAYEIIKELYRVLVVQRLVGSFNASTGTGTGLIGLISGAFTKQADGGVWSQGSQLRKFANGGVVSGATMFKTNTGLGIMGEAGPEAIMPLTRGANGKLGVQASGSGGDTIIVNNDIHVSGSGVDVTAIRSEIMKAVPAIVDKTKSAIIDARRRGGQMKNAFGG
jgi:tape measure domain-containing protein